MKFKKFHGYILEALFGIIPVSVLFWGLMILNLSGNLPVAGTEKERIMFILTCALAPFLIWRMMFSYVRSGTREDGGHILDEIEMDSEGIRLHSRKTGDAFMTWENVVEILDVRSYMTPFEIIVRGTNAEINFFGNFKARRYIKRKIGLRIKKAPSNWRERTDWRKKYDTKM